MEPRELWNMIIRDGISAIDVLAFVKVLVWLDKAGVKILDVDYESGEIELGAGGHHSWLFLHHALEAIQMILSEAQAQANLNPAGRGTLDTEEVARILWEVGDGPGNES